jgi:hypothetical protein
LSKAFGEIGRTNHQGHDESNTQHALLHLRILDTDPPPRDTGGKANLAGYQTEIPIASKTGEGEGFLPPLML